MKDNTSFSDQQLKKRWYTWLFMGCSFKGKVDSSCGVSFFVMCMVMALSTALCAPLSLSSTEALMDSLKGAAFLTPEPYCNYTLIFLHSRLMPVWFFTSCLPHGVPLWDRLCCVPVTLRPLFREAWCFLNIHRPFVACWIEGGCVGGGKEMKEGC